MIGCVLVCVHGAGEGTLEVTVMTGTSPVPHTVKPVGNSTHAVMFTPQTAEPHSAVVKFNGEMVPGMSTAAQTFTCL